LAGKDAKQPRCLTGPPEIGEFAEVADEQTIDVLGEPLEAPSLIAKTRLGEAASGCALHERGPTSRSVVHPVSTGVVVSAMARPEWLVEIDVTAVKSG